MGLLTGLLALKLNLSQEARAFLTTGILGGFTTFSAFSLDVALLMERKAHLAAGAYAAGSVVLSLAAVFAGLHLIRLIVQ
jgi:CrcB protein